MAQKIHYHTDCAFFGGCENMLVNFWSSVELRKSFEITFSYRYTQRYNDGLIQRAKINFPIFPLRFLDLSDIYFFQVKSFSVFRRNLGFFLRLVLICPIFIYEIWVLRRLFLNVRPDVLHINNGGYPGAMSARAAVIAARLSGVSHIVMVVNNMASNYGRPSRWFGYLLDRLIAHSVTMFVTGSIAAATQLCKVLRLDKAKKCVSIHNGVVLRSLTESRNETLRRLGLGEFEGVIFGVVAIMRPNKGHMVLLEALHKLVNDDCISSSGIKVILEGDGPLRIELQAFVEANQLSDYCFFVGEEKNIGNFMTAIDVLILPSIDHEDFPNVIIEAMGLGKPVIASQLAGIPEQVINGITGLLVPPQDMTQLAMAIKYLYFDGGLRLKMGQAGFKRFRECFSANVAVGNYLNLYKSLIEMRIT